jgi:amino acid permease
MMVRLLGLTIGSAEHPTKSVPELHASSTTRVDVLFSCLCLTPGILTPVNDVFKRETRAEFLLRIYLTTPLLTA